MKLKYFIALAGMTAALAAWIAIGVGFVIGVERQTWVLLVIVAAVATEAMMWCLAAALGIAVLRQRWKIWRWLMQRLAIRFDRS